MTAAWPGTGSPKAPGLPAPECSCTTAGSRPWRSRRGRGHRRAITWPGACIRSACAGSDLYIPYPTTGASFMAAVSPLPRTRGGISGIMLILLGAWGAVVPFVGPYFGYSNSPDTAWTYTTGRLWLSVLPGAAALLGGIMVLLAASRPAAMSGAMLAALGGAWFAVGSWTATVLGTGFRPGVPVAGPGSAFSAPVMRLLEGLGFFYGLGVVIVFFAALALGRFAVAAVPAGYTITPRPAEPARPQGYRPA